MTFTESKRSTVSYVIPSLDVYCVIIFVMSTLLTLSLRRVKARRLKFPSGHDGVPVLGILPYLTKHPLRLFKKWSLEKYGPVMSVKVMDRKVVVLNTYDVIKEVFDKRSLVSSGRAKSFLFGQIQGDHGLTFIDYNKNLISQKNIGQMCFSKFGAWHDITNDEIDFLVKKLSANQNKPIDVRIDLFNASANIISKFVFGKRFEYGGSVLKQFFGTFDNILGNSADGRLLALIELKPFLRHVPPFYGANKRFLERSKGTMDLISSIIDVANHDPGTPCNSLVSCFLAKHNSGSEDATQFQKEQQVAYIRDILGAGIKNVYVTIYWAILCLLHHSEYHEVLKKEIDRYFDKSGRTDVNKGDLPFTYAFIEEVFRVCSPLPKTLDHKSHSEIKVLDYTIPANTLISGNLWGAHHDPETWKDPKTFDPYRHIRDDGSFQASGKVIPFSIGPRSCFGEKIGIVVVHTTFVRIVRRFKIRPSGILPEIEDGEEGVTCDPPNFDVVLEEREK